MKILTDVNKQQKLYEKYFKTPSGHPTPFFPRHLSRTFGTKANNDEKNPFYASDFCRRESAFLAYVPN